VPTSSERIGDRLVEKGSWKAGDEEGRARLAAETSWDNRPGFEKTQSKTPQIRSTTRSDKLNGDGQDGGGLDGNEQGGGRLDSDRLGLDRTTKEEKTKQNLQRDKENTETRRGEKERQSLSLLPGKTAQGGREDPTKEAAEINLGFFPELLSLNMREK
jgi:hypothetical protein